jgi:60 kDa SS-A/Ro ribonucleoprotein
MNAKELFTLVHEARKERGWGRSLRHTVAAWYGERPVAEVAADILECPEHNGYTHRDLLRLAHPKPKTAAQNALFQWASEGRLGHLATPDLLSGDLRQIYAVERIRGAGDEHEVLTLIDQYGLSPDMVPIEWKGSGPVWEVLVERMDCAELVENLIALAETGTLAPETAITALVVARLIDRRRVRNSGLSPETLSCAREEYARHPRAARVVIQALDAAIEIARS